MSGTAIAEETADVKQAVLVTSGDLRLAANQTCWPAQAELERKLEQVFSKEGVRLK